MSTLAILGCLVGLALIVAQAVYLARLDARDRRRLAELEKLRRAEEARRK